MSAARLVCGDECGGDPSQRRFVLDARGCCFPPAAAALPLSSLANLLCSPLPARSMMMNKRTLCAPSSRVPPADPVVAHGEGPITPLMLQRKPRRGPEDESILNGSMMLAESNMHIEGESKNQFKPPPGVPSINPAANAAKRTVVQLPPITQQQLQQQLPASSPPAASATPLAVKADISTASVALPAPARSGFTPSNSTDCNTEAQFALLRTELRDTASIASSLTRSSRAGS